MGISLNGLTPAGTYPGLIKTGDNTAIDGTLKVLSDGNGNNLPMEVSTTGVNFTNQLQQGGVAVPTASQVAAKQDTLVSGTNIKTINGTSVLGSGNIVTPSTNPSGVSGAIQFSDGSAFASDATKFFWDNTNKRLGIGTNSPSAPLDVNGTADGVTTLRFKSQFSAFGSLWTDNTNVGITRQIRGTSSNACITLGTVGVGIRNTGDHTATATLDIKGSGSTSATTSLLVQNSAGTQLLKIADDGRADFNGFVVFNGNMTTISSFIVQGGLFGNNYQIDTTGATCLGAAAAAAASALLDIRSTTRGFLPPRMTTTQINAIASPANGLEVYNTTLNCPCFYNGTSWRQVTNSAM